MNQVDQKFLVIIFDRLNRIEIELERMKALEIKIEKSNNDSINSTRIHGRVGKIGSTGENQHLMLILSPKAVATYKHHKPMIFSSKNVAKAVD